jgi:hypothetical protein
MSGRQVTASIAEISDTRILEMVHRSKEATEAGIPMVLHRK